MLLAAEQTPDLVVLDWMIKGTSGIEVCRRLRRDMATAQVPVVMLTAREAEDDRIRGLETSADDYVIKPFSPRELMARVAAIMCGIRPTLAGEMLTIGALSLDAAADSVLRAGRTVSRGQLLDAVWYNDSDIEIRTIDAHVYRLRKNIKIDGANDPVRNVRSAGYALEPD